MLLECLLPCPVSREYRTPLHLPLSKEKGNFQLDGIRSSFKKNGWSLVFIPSVILFPGGWAGPNDLLLINGNSQSGRCHFMIETYKTEVWGLLVVS
jgi:hypothetical protein